MKRIYAEDLKNYDEFLIACNAVFKSKRISKITETKVFDVQTPSGKFFKIKMVLDDETCNISYCFGWNNTDEYKSERLDDVWNIFDPKPKTNYMTEDEVTAFLGHGNIDNV